MDMGNNSEEYIRHIIEFSIFFLATIEASHEYSKGRVYNSGRCDLVLGNMSVLESLFLVHC